MEMIMMGLYSHNWFATNRKCSLKSSSASKLVIDLQLLTSNFQFSSKAPQPQIWLSIYSFRPQISSSPRKLLSLKSGFLGCKLNFYGGYINMSYGGYINMVNENFFSGGILLVYCASFSLSYFSLSYFDFL